MFLIPIYQVDGIVLAIRIAHSASGKMRRDVLYAQLAAGAVRHAAEDGDIEEVCCSDDLLLCAPRAVLLHLCQVAVVVSVDGCLTWSASCGRVASGHKQTLHIIQ